MILWNYLLSHHHNYDIDTLIAKLKSCHDHFTVLSINMQSIKAKWSLFTATLDCLFDQEVLPCAIFMQETWLESDMNLYDIANYESFYLKPTCSTHGGLATYIRKDFSAKMLDIYLPSFNWEGQFFEGKGLYCGQNVVLANIYKPPRQNNNHENVSSFMNDLNACLDRIDSADNIIIAGDFNIDLLKIHNNTVFNSYFENFLRRGFISAITKPTRFSNYNATLIDHVFIKSMANYSYIFGSIITTKISDHLATFCGIPFSKPDRKRPTIATVSSYSVENMSNFLHEVDLVDWNGVLNTRLIDDPNDKFIET